MVSHEASGQLLGYLYQIRYALLLLLDNDNPDFKISIEKFDDISFEKNFSPKEMIQTKHHVKKGDLSDNSVDLWKTINVWLDLIESNPERLSSCRFLIITTQTAKDETAVSFLRRNNRNEKKAIELLKNIAFKGHNKNLNNIYHKFLNTDRSNIESLFNSVEVIDGAPQIQQIEQKLKKRIRFCCYPNYLDKVFAQVEGWWYKLAIDALVSEDHSILDSLSAQNMIVSIGQQYQQDNLPIEDWIFEEFSDENIQQTHPIFIQQLKIINSNEKIIRCAIKNFYRAYKQRSSWSRENLLLPNEIENYDKKLIDEWELTNALLDDDYHDVIKQGKELYKQVISKDIRIRARCSEPFIMRGSFEMLSDRLQVGWHRDYKSIIKSRNQKEI